MKKLTRYILICSAVAMSFGSTIRAQEAAPPAPEITEEDLFNTSATPAPAPEAAKSEAAPAPAPGATPAEPATLEDISAEEEGALPLEDQPSQNAEAPAAQPAEQAVEAPAPMPTEEEITPAEAALSPEPKESAEANYYPSGVEVERSVYSNAQKKCNCEYNYLMPYKERRGTWGFTVGVGYSQFTPTNYKPDFVVNEAFHSYYGLAETPMMELTLGAKWNNGLGSLAIEFGGGYYANQGNDDSTLTAMPARLGVTLVLDTLFHEPYIAPYVGGGAYSTFYKETLASQSVNGNSPIGFYWLGGVAFQLNGLDESAAIRSFDETGLENTFIYVEARSFLSSSDVPDFGTDPQVGAGLKLEY